jgi:hypothetical protein
MSNDANPGMGMNAAWLHVWAFANPGVASKPATANNVTALTLFIALLLTDSAMTKLPILARLSPVQLSVTPTT